MRFTLRTLVERNARLWPDSVALIEDDTQVSWSQFAARVARLRTGLKGQGLGVGSRVAVLDRTSINYVALQYALCGIGAVMVPINVWYRSGEVAHVLDDTEPDAFVVGGAQLELGEKALQRAAVAPTLISHEAPDLPAAARLEDLMGESIPADTAPEPVGWDAPHMILYTSGTSSRPKGVVQTQRRALVDAFSAIGVLGLQHEDRLLCYFALFHTAGWDYIKMMFVAGGSVVLLPAFDAEQAVEAIERHRCTFAYALPLMQQRMFASKAWPTADLSSFRLLGFGTADSSAVDFDAVIGAFAERGASIELAALYGLTEGGPFVSILRPTTDHALLVSVGRPVPHADVALLDDSLNEVPRGEPGEICVRSEAVLTEYWRQPEATEAVMRGDWMHTGDLGRIDDQGYLFIVGRKKEMIRTGAENVFPREVELVLLQHPAVEDCAVIGVPDPEYEERVVAVVVASQSVEPDEAALIAHVRREIAGYKTPKNVVFVDELPRTGSEKLGTAKLNKAALRERYEALALTQSSATTPDVTESLSAEQRA
ncbi:MAG: fatty-acyl-CoA synthase [Solirubrobacteraceae bacterium]|nr:fatty-acyl-CoA synthase [Solirubrobacteraceae bacterium]